jgi:hypothetical protein
MRESRAIAEARSGYRRGSRQKRLPCRAPPALVPSQRLWVRVSNEQEFFISQQMQSVSVRLAKSSVRTLPVAPDRRE